jgi:hypothetical protein
MSATGATPEQIEAALDRGWWPKGALETKRDVCRQLVEGYAEDLVPPGSLIFEDEDIEALRVVVGWVSEDITDWHLDPTGPVAVAHARLAALVSEVA